MTTVQYELYPIIFGKWNKFTNWLYDLLMFHSMKFEIDKNQIKLMKTGFEKDLLSLPYEEVYNMFDFKLINTSELDSINNNKPIYKQPLIKALYYSFKHLGK